MIKYYHDIFGEKIMQFRIMGKRIQCLRSHYNPKKKMGEQKLIASIDANIEKLPDDLSVLSALTQDELKQFEQWLEKRKAKQDLENAKNTIDNAPAMLANILQAIRNNPAFFTNEKAILLASALQELETVLKPFGLCETVEKKQQTKSIFADFKKEILELKKQTKTVNEILAYLQEKAPNLANDMTYNGLRSYIRRQK